MKTTVERIYLETLEGSIEHIAFPEILNQYNKETGRAYKKLNNLILLAKKSEMDYTSNQWLSATQLKNSDYEVKEGQEPTQLFSFKIKDMDYGHIEGTTGEFIPKKEKVYSYYTVYNLDQLQKKSQSKAS